MKIERILRPTPLTRAIERVVREDEGRADVDAEAVKLDLNERKREKENPPFPERESAPSLPGERITASLEETNELVVPKLPLRIIA
jgi:hypothetical protein